jgi:hypothetical protein
MKRFAMAAVLFGLVLSSALSAQGMQNIFHYRFLWPADLKDPGRNLIELKARESGSSPQNTPLGNAEVKSFDLSDSGGEVVARVKLMKLSGRDDVLIFMTEVLKAIPAPTGKYENPAFALPAVRPDKRYKNVLDYKIEVFSAPTHKRVPTTGPVVMYANDLDALIMSPLDNFMSVMQSPVKGEWRCGFGGMLEQIPAGTVNAVILVSGRGINDTFMKWGGLIQKWHGHKTADTYADVAMSRLGYWTDNGAYYYYRTEPGKTYAQTLLDVKADAEKQGIQYGYFQLDSWWYPKARVNDRSSHDRGGFMLWEPNADMFPQGLPEFQKQLGLSLVAHNRYVADESPYCKRYNCVFSNGDKKKGAYPTDPAFWEEIMDNAKKFGIAVYEQDWLVTHMDMIPWMRSGIHNAEGWYDNMANAAQKRGITMQLCMASPEFFMQAMKHPNETHARTSHDYKGGLPKAFFWMPFHKAGLFAYAVGLWPFKDNFQSSSGQRATYNILPEANPMEEALVSALSGGPVGPSDMIGKSDASVILRTCRKDGLLLKPDRPATPIDIMFLYNKSELVGGKKPWVVTTESRHEIGKTTYLAAFNLWPANMYEPFVSFSEAGISGKHLIYNYMTGEYKIVSDRVSFGLMPPEKAFYYVLCPVLSNGMAVIGETNKFVTMSAKRFPEVKLSDGVLSMTVAGVPGEKISVSIYFPALPRNISGASLEGKNPNLPGLITVSLVIPGSGMTELKIQ